MARKAKAKTNLKMRRKKSDPPGKIKIANALRQLLETKDFNSITTSEIAITSGANEALIYRYFGDKRGLLHQVLDDYLNAALEEIRYKLIGIKGAIEKLKTVISFTIEIYDQQRVFAKIILVEVRNFPGFFKSDTYQWFKSFSQLISDIVGEGIESGEFRDDIPVKFIRDAVIGSIEHYVLPNVLFNRKFDQEICAENLCKILFDGIIAREQTA
jgi:AcrR family transcriptional regulator